MKKIILSTTIICGFAFPAMATMETRLVEGCVVYPIPHTNAWQKQDPDCNFNRLGLGIKGDGKIGPLIEEEEPPVDPEDPVDPVDPEPEEPTEPEEPSEPEEPEDTKPGWGHGDDNHDHSGPPGLNKKGSKK